MMSMYDNHEKDELFDLIKEFLKHHPVHELLKIVKDAVKRCEEAENKYRMLKGELEGFPSNTRMNIRW